MIDLSLVVSQNYNDEEIRRKSFLWKKLSVEVRTPLKEKRRSKRIIEEDEVSITVTSLDEVLPAKKAYGALTKDISMSGMKIRSNTFLPINACFKLKISFGSPRQIIYTYGKVRWVKRLSSLGLFEIGLEFLNSSSGDLKILRERIEKKNR
jgi:hypothetical protein